MDWKIYALLAAVFASLTAIFGKIGVEGIPSNLATLIRTLVVIVFLIILVSISREFQVVRTLSSRTWLFLILSGLATGLSWICYFRALQLGPVSKVAPIDKMSLGLTILIAVTFLGETISWQTLVGAVMIIGGSLMMLL